MTGYNLVFLLLQKIEELQKELQNYIKEVYINRNVASERMAELSIKAYKQREKHDDIIIGYLSGSITHNPDMELIKPTIIKLMKKYNNVKIKHADMTKLNCRDNRFDKVVAGNVIHLLEEPYAAINELERVCKPGGKIIIPTYINASGGINRKAVFLFELAGADFKRQFDFNSYRKFFEDAGYRDARYEIVYGRMPCAVAIITKQ